MEEGDERSVSAKEADIFSEDFLLKRPLLQAISQTDRAPVLLIDEIDRADIEFESFLLEVLSDFQVTVPEIGTITAAHRPDVVLTSNRSRDLSDALRRRCLYLWIDYPSFDKEVRILRTKVPGINERLAGQIARVMQNLRRRQLQKVPGVAESLDWASALVALHADHLDAELARETLGCVLKEVDDVKRIEADLAAGRLSELLEG
jgi:MoxR-like ATPase